MSARSFWCLLALLPWSMAQIFRCRTSSSLGTGSSTPRTARCSAVNEGDSGHRAKTARADRCFQRPSSGYEGSARYGNHSRTRVRARSDRQSRSRLTIELPFSAYGRPTRPLDARWAPHLRGRTSQLQPHLINARLSFMAPWRIDSRRLSAVPIWRLFVHVPSVRARW